MKYLFASILIVVSCLHVNSQSCTPVLDEISRISNDFRQGSNYSLAHLIYDTNATDPFFNGDGNTKLFDLGFAKGIWAGALDPAGNLKVAASGYSAQADFIPGPIIEEYQNDPLFCAFFTRVWNIESDDIIEYKIQYQSGSLDLETIPIDILEWPAYGNPYIFDFDISVGLAPFFDHDGNGMYDPLTGDHPITLEDNPDFLPSQFRFYVFNDKTVHFQSHADPLNMEFHIMDYVIDCPRQTESETSIFTRLKYINKGYEELRNFKLGIWEDTDLGCYRNDAIGCNQSLNTSYYYNAYGTDDDIDCPDLQTIPDEYGVVRSLILLENELESFMYYYNCGIVDPAPQQCSPQISEQYYNLLNAQWLDGQGLTEGGNGFNPNSTEFTSFAFPDFPNQSEGWSMLTADIPPSDMRSISVVDVEDILAPGQVGYIDLADHVLISREVNGLDIFEAYETAISEVKIDFQKMKEGEFDCSNLMSLSSNLTNFNLFQVFPNPSRDFVQLNFNELQKDGTLSIYSSEGKKLKSFKIKNEQNYRISLTDFESGIYMLTLQSPDGQFQSENFIKM